MSWSINPHMRPGAVDVLLAARQHKSFVAALRLAGASLIELPFVHGAFDSVFAKDSAILATRGRQRFALPASFAQEERQREQTNRQASLEARGFSVLDPPLVPLEGGDVVQPARGPVLLGHGFRSSRHAAPLLEQVLNREVLALELVDSWLYHLDTALAALDDGTLLVCPEAFSMQSMRRLLSHPEVGAIRLVPRGEALRFGLNMVQLGTRVFTGGYDTPVTDGHLTDRGLEIVRVDLSQFHLAGGSAACLVSALHPERRVAISDTSEILSTS